jgi:hypothetical protein
MTAIRAKAGPLRHFLSFTLLRSWFLVLGSWFVFTFRFGIERERELRTPENREP